MPEQHVLDFQDRNVLGVIVPMLEEIRDLNVKNVALIGTEGMVRTKTYTAELAKISQTSIDEFATPLLVPLIENDGEFLIDQTIDHYRDGYKLPDYDGVILGCTHYTLIKNQIREAIGSTVSVLSQDEIIPAKLAQYLTKHSDMEATLSKGSNIEFFVTDYTDRYQTAANKLFGKSITLQKVHT